MPRKSGMWGRPGLGIPKDVPDDVREAVRQLLEPTGWEVDWTMLAGGWFVARLWEHEGAYRVMVAKTVWESDLVEVD